jgi:Xaa-Pro aminopeptidase
MKLENRKSIEPLLNTNRLKKMLEKYNLDILLASTPSNVQYVTGFRPVEELTSNPAGSHQTFAILFRDCPDIILIIPQSDIAFFCCSNSWANEIEVYGGCYQFSGVELNAKEKQVIEICQYSKKSEYRNILEALKSVLNKLKLKNKCIGIDEMYLDPKLLNEITASFPQTEVKYANYIFSEIRAVKTLAELAKIKESIRITEGAINTALSAIRMSVSEVEMAYVLLNYIIKEGAFPMLWYVGLGRSSSLIDREAFSSQKVSSGDWIMFDVGCRFGGYGSDLARSYVYKEPSKRQKDYYRAIQKGREEAISLIRPGVMTEEILDAAIRAIRREGIPHFDRIGIGHGIGCDLHEAPFLTKSNKMPIEKGMVICVETPYYEIGWGGIQLEDTILVTDDGVEFLSTLPVELKTL